MEKGKLYKDRDWLEEQYVDKKLSMSKIADLASCSTGTVWQWLDKLKIPRRKRGHHEKVSDFKDKEWLREEYLENNKSTKEIGDSCGKSKTTILKWLEEFDIPRRENKPRKRSIKTECDQCGKVIEIHLNEMENHEHHFCSKECFHKWQSVHWVGENNPSWNGGLVETTCEYCGKTYKTTLSLAKRQRFCSRECYSKWQSENLSGSNSYQWKGGANEYMEKRGKAPGYWRKNKRKALKRDDETCEFCGSNEKLDVHHIVSVREGGTNYIGNLITVCRSCHQEIESAR